MTGERARVRGNPIEFVPRGRAGSTAKGGAVPAGPACRCDPGAGGMRRISFAVVTHVYAVTSPPSGAPAPRSDAHAAPAFVHDVGVDHRRLDAGMAQQLLHGADVVAVLQQVRGERVAQRVAAHVLDDAGDARRLLYARGSGNSRKRGGAGSRRSSDRPSACTTETRTSSPTRRARADTCARARRAVPRRRSLRRDRARAAP